MAQFLVVRQHSRMEDNSKPDYAVLAHSLIFLAWIISLMELGLLFFMYIGAGLSAGSAPHFPAWVLLLLAAGSVAIFMIAFVVLSPACFTIGRCLLMAIPGLLGLLEFTSMLLLLYSG